MFGPTGMYLLYANSPPFTLFIVRVDPCFSFFFECMVGLFYSVGLYLLNI